MSCDRINQVHAYHDGELASSDRVALEQHLQTCEECTALLADLQKLSQLIASAPLVQIHPAAMAELREHQFIPSDAGVMRIAGWLTAAAAAVLVAALPFWPGPTSTAASNTQSTLIETIAVNPPAENVADESHSDTIADAQWMADNFSIDSVNR